VHHLFALYCNTSDIVIPDGTVRNIRTLRDKGAMQSLLKEVPGYIDFTHTGESRVLKGITKDMITVPLVEVHLRNDFIDEPVLCGLVPDLPYRWDRLFDWQ